MEDKTNSRVVIIGAGAAGLTAASTLRDKGYRNVIVLERDDHAGGKCATIDIDGHNYELGAGIVSSANKTVLSLAKKNDVQLSPTPIGESLVLDAKSGAPRKKRTVRTTIALVKQLFIYRRLQKKHARLARPGFAGIDHKTLAMPFADFAKKHGIEALAKELELSHTGFGYGYFVDVPAAYILKYYSWSTICAFIQRRLYFFPHGIQHLWTAVATHLDVRYNVTIEKVTRGDEITITISDTSDPLVCDKLIVAAPLDEMLSYVDATANEKKLFSDIRHVHYSTIACSIEDFPKKTGYAPGNFFASRAGHPVFWYHRHPETAIYTFYALGDGKPLSDDVLTKHVAAFVRAKNGSFKKVHTVRHWKYFPHVSPEHMRDGYYDTLESMQGKQNTYYVGELLNFSTVGLTAQYAKSLIENSF